MDKKHYEHLNCIPDMPDFSSLDFSKGLSDIPEHSEAYKKYVLPVLECEKQKRTEWLWSKGILILNTILAGIAAISSLLALLKP